MMAKPKIHESRLMMIGAQSARWPDDASDHYWKVLRESIDTIRSAVRDADHEIADAEADQDLSDAGRMKRIGSIAMVAIQRLQNKPVFTAARVVVKVFVEEEDKDRPDVRSLKPTTPFEIALDSEIRGAICAKEQPEIFVTNHRANRDLVRAVMSAPAFCSGLTEEQKNTFGGHAAASLWPEATKQRDAAEKALDEMEKALRVGLGMIADRGQLLKTADGWKERPAMTKAA
jgi:hypothetical protein